MINLFQFASNDKSLQYLNDIFGSMNGIIYNPSGGGGVGITLLGTMFKTFNTVILAVAALVVVYVTIVGVMKTAHEGEPLGKHWNNLWIPIRMVLGIAALVPTGSGYCAIQLVMMWVIVQGIGAADTLWNTVLGYVNVAGSPYGQVTIPSVSVYSSLNGLFQALTCEATSKISSTDPSRIDKGGYFCNGNNSGYCSSPTAFISNNASNTTMQIGPGGACGTLTYCNQAASCAQPSSLSCAACKAQVAALTQIIPVLSNIAQKFAQADYSYRDFYYNSSVQKNTGGWSWIYDYCEGQTPSIPQSQCCVPSRSPTQICKANQGNQGVPGNLNFPNPNADGYPQNASEEAVKNLYWPYAIKPLVGGNVDFINTSVVYYTNTIGAAVADYINALGQNKALSGDLGDAAKTGWIFAGSYYYAIAKGNNKNVEDAIPDISVTVKDPNSSTSNAMRGFRNNYSAAAQLMSASSGTSALSSNAETSQVSAMMGTANNSATQTFAASASGSGGSNPLSALQITGTIFLAIVMLLFPAMMLLAFGLGVAGHINWFSLGTGMISPIGGGVTLAYLFIVPAVFGFMGILVSLGGTLGIYVPLIPYIVFTFGAIGWMIMTIETMVAAPLVALGILAPSGEDLLGRAQGALLPLLDVFLRPSLMIFGLIAAMLLATVAVSMVNYAFWTTVLKGVIGADGAAMANPIELIIYLSAYVSLLVAVLNKCFQSIYVIPQGVMRWIGGQGASYGGEGEGVQAAEKGIGTAGSGISGGAKTGEAQAQQMGTNKYKLKNREASNATGADSKPK